MLLSYAIVEFYFFYDVVNMQMWALLTRSQCWVSVNQVTVKACGPPVLNKLSKFYFIISKLSVKIVIQNKHRDNNKQFSGSIQIVFVCFSGIVVSVKKQAEKKIQREKRLRMACEKELSKYREYCTTQEQEIELMKGLLLKHGIDLHESQTQPPEVSKMDIIADINLVAETEKGQPPPLETPPAVEHPDTPDSN